MEIKKIRRGNRYNKITNWCSRKKLSSKIVKYVDMVTVNILPHAYDSYIVLSEYLNTTIAIQYDIAEAYNMNIPYIRILSVWIEKGGDRTETVDLLDATCENLSTLYKLGAYTGKFCVSSIKFLSINTVSCVEVKKNEQRDKWYEGIYILDTDSIQFIESDFSKTDLTTHQLVFSDSRYARIEKMSDNIDLLLESKEKETIKKLLQIYN